MPNETQLLLAVLAAVILANVLLLATIPLRAFARRRQRTALARDVDLGDDGDTRTAAAIEDFVAEVTAGTSGFAAPPTPDEVMARRREVLAGMTAAPAAIPATDGPEEPPVTTAPRSAPEPVSPVPGLAEPARWERVVRDESARFARFGRPVTVVMAELADLEGVTDRLGRDVADRVVVETARLLASTGRAVDPVTRLGDATFGILLLETEEARASRYIDRVRAAADDWLDSAGLSIRLSLGSASPADGRDLAAAAALARQRMHEAFSARAER